MSAITADVLLDRPVRAFVALDPDTGQRLGVAWNELDALPMLDAADAKLREAGHGRARLDPAFVSRTPEQMRRVRAEREQAERRANYRARLEALYRPPEGYTLRRYPPLAPSTLRRRFDPGRALRRIAEAEDWVHVDAGGYGQEVIPLACRDLILIADPPKRRMPMLYIATNKGRRAVGMPPWPEHATDG